MKTVTVNIVKTFDTEAPRAGHAQHGLTRVNPYKNNLEGFVIKRFRGGNGPAEERDALRPEFQMMGSQPRQREFDV